ncbi:MAG: hypothetical protein QOF13_719 [Solirubrobacterales bacterium]|nr:hypothetical protein [Solirubrobacterales bacterium]
MERAAWTDERLDELSRRMDAGFDRVDRDIHALRGEMNAGFAELRKLFYRGGSALFLLVAASLFQNL